jgi:dTDP-4-dehydrorhamnose reductase
MGDRVAPAAAAAGRSRGAGEQDGAHRLGGDAAREGVIIRAAVMFAPDDAFLTTILRLLRSLPAYPMFCDGRTRLQPAYADDVAAAIAEVVRQSKKPRRAAQGRDARARNCRRRR